MKYSTAILAAAGLVAAQSPTDFFPTCAISCLEDAIKSATTCKVTDFTCQCTDANQAAIQGGATACVISACGADVAVASVLPAAKKFCAAVAAGGGGASSSAASSGSAAPTSAAPTSAAQTGTPAPTSTAADSSKPAGTMTKPTGGSASGTGTPMSSGTTMPGSTTTPVVVSGAEGHSVHILGGVAALFLAVVAAL